MRHSVIPNLPKWVAPIALSVLAFMQSGRTFAATFSILDYCHPVYEGNEWIYQADGLGDSGNAMIERIEATSAPVTCYSNRTSPTAFVRNAVSVYEAYGDYSDTTFTPGEEWHEYQLAQGSWGMLGSDAIDESIRANPGFLLPATMIAGQSVAMSGEIYLSGVYVGLMTMRWQLLGQASVTVPAGTYADCLHFRYVVAQPGQSQTIEEWWARGVGKVKKTRHVVKPGVVRDEVYQLVSANIVLGPWIAFPPASTAAAIGAVASFSVHAHGEEPLSYEWRKDDVTLADQPGILSGAATAQLAIANVQSNDLAGYSVVVSNAYGAVTSAVATLSLVSHELVNVKPTVAVTLPTRNARQTASTIVAIGKARDNSQVAAVWYQLNSSDWLPAIGTTDWSTPDLPLTPGPNLLRVFAVDTSGNHSLTNSVTFTYVVQVPVQVQSVGLGRIAPNYNGKLLEIGQRYRMGAVGIAGFRFHDWSGSLDTNYPVLSFTMASNLSFTATFVDVTRPVNVVLSPIVRQVVKTATLNIAGRAADNFGVQTVWYQLNGTGWMEATTTNRWLNWLARDVPVQPGNNVLQAFAEDAAGNRSLTNSVSFTSTVVVPNIAGFWNIGSFNTPTEVFLENGNILQGGYNFDIRRGTMTIDANGLITGDNGGPFTGSCQVGPDGELLATIASDESTNTYTLHLNNSQDTITYVGGYDVANGNHQELMVFQRAPLSAAGTSLAGSWNVAQFDTPNRLTWDPNTGLQGGSEFSAVAGTMVTRADGTFVANVNGPATGRYTVGDDGQVLVSLNGQSETNVLSLNAGKDFMVLGNGGSRSQGDSQEVMLFVRAPASVTKADLAGIWNGTAFRTPAAMTGSPQLRTPGRRQL